MERKKSSKPWKITLIFSLVFAVFCGLYFLFHYPDPYSSGDGMGIFTPSEGVVLSRYLFGFVAILVSIVLKIIFRKDAHFLKLLLASVVVPIICYNLNYHAFNKGGPLRLLVEEGGPLYFIVIDDYNFDGINDEYYHRKYEKRTHPSYYSTYDTTIDHVNTYATGIGTGLEGTFCFYDEDSIALYLERDGVEFEEIRIKVTFEDESHAEKTVFRINSKKIPTEVSGGVATLTFDSETCKAFQEAADSERIKMIIKYKN